MGHVVREVPWCVIDLDTTVGRIFLQERWLYVWEVNPGQPAWTLEEKRAFHTRADRAIWAAWSNRVTMNVDGTSAFAGRFKGKPVPINLDVRWVTSKPHWTVHVTKIARGAFRQSNVEWDNHVINLDTEDFSTRTFEHGAARETQTPVAHEFGHTVGNTAVLNRGDEYRDTSPNQNDHGSIMNHGHHLRERHFRTIIEELNKMIPNTTFSVRSV
ncbi:MAG: hypothetical protein LC126_02420 [Bryobacterales bacterium]|nr:hypothetical protein [Bryobacterales bacterium]